MFARRSIRTALAIAALALGGASISALAPSVSAACDPGAAGQQYCDPFPHIPKAHVGQSCNPRKRPPKGFSCRKHGHARHAKYRLVRR